MKSKKLFLPTIVIVISVFLMAVYSVVSSIALKPTVTEGEFPFSITYEFNGETVTVNDVYKVHYDRNDGYADTKSRIYLGEIGTMGEGNTLYTINENPDGRIILHTNFYPDYMMGDSEYEYFDDETFQPKIYYYDAQEQEYDDEETLLAQGVKLISFKYPSPIENTLVFSHISYFNGKVVIPTLVIALLALIVILIFVRKEKELKYKAADVVSIVLNFIISLIMLPIVSILAMFIDIEGGGPEFYYQVLYFVPALSVLCIATSIALRRKGYGIKSLIAELIGPAVFALYLIACVVFETL